MLGSKFRGHSSRFWVQVFRVQASGYMVQGLGFRVRPGLSSEQSWRRELLLERHKELSEVF